MLSERWKTAVKQAKARMDKLDYKILQSFRSGDALLADLRRRQVEANSKTTRLFARAVQYVVHCRENNFILTDNFCSDVGPFVRAANLTAGTFLIAMAPHTPELAVIWGLFHLMITVCPQNSQTLVIFG